MNVSSLAHIALHVTDMEESLRFYKECLGLHQIFELKNDNDENWLIYLKICDYQFIELFYGAKQKRVIPWPVDGQEITPEQSEVIDHEICTHFCLQVKDIFEMAQRIKDFGYKIVLIEPTKGKDNNYECFTQDPDGNLIEFMQYTEDALQLKDYPEDKDLL